MVDRMNMDAYTIESFLFSSEFEGEDRFLLASTSSSDDSDEECACSHKTKTPSKRLKKTDGFAEVTVPNLKPDDFKSHFRVDRTTFEKILEIIINDFTSEHKDSYENISPEKTALILLWYLGNQETFEEVSDRFQLTVDCVYNILKTGTKSLSGRTSEHILWPSSGKYTSIAKLFRDSCELKDVIGAVGLSYIEIPKPKQNCSAYVSKIGYSMAIQGVVTINGKFIDIYVIEGSTEPEDILNKSSIPIEANKGLFKNFSLIGHRAYPKHSWLLQPIEDDGNLTPRQTHFNMCYETGFSIVAGAFGLLKGRFQHLHKIESSDVLFTKQCVEAACVIHNICIDGEDDGERFSCDDIGLLE